METQSLKSEIVKKDALLEKQTKHMKALQEELAKEKNEVGKFDARLKSERQKERTVFIQGFKNRMNNFKK